LRTNLFERSATSAIPTRATIARTLDGNSGAVEVVVLVVVVIGRALVLVVVEVVVLVVLVVEDVVVAEVGVGE
jgi:hypothetical protein